MPDAGAPRGGTVGADKGYDAARCVDELRTLDVTPHIARKVAFSVPNRHTTTCPRFGPRPARDLGR